MRKNGIINDEGKMLSSGIKFIVLGNEYVENLNKLKVTCTYDWYLLVKVISASYLQVIISTYFKCTWLTKN